MRNNGIQLRVGDLLFAVRKRWTLIAGLTFAGLVLGLLLSGMTYVRGSLQSYEINGSVAISTQTPYGKYINGSDYANHNDFVLSEDMVDAVIYVIRSRRVLDQVVSEQRLPGVSASQIRSSLSLRQYESTQILEMTLAWQSAEEGLAIWNSILAAANRVIPETLMLGSLHVINEADAERVGASGSTGNIWALMAMLGFAAGVGFAVMELLTHPTLTNAKDVEPLFGLETLGTIPEDGAYYRRKTSLLIEDDAFPEITQSYTASAYILRNRLGSKEKHHCFYVTSAVGREGRSTVAANLAIQLSDMEQRTLLVDLDSRNPGLGALFLGSVDYDRSLNALYRGDCTEREAITTLTGYLDLLPLVAEHKGLAMDGMIMELIQRLSEKYDYIILDAPPVGKEAETLSLNQVADTVLYVIGYDKATIPEIQAALDKLGKSGIRVLGCIVNGVPGAQSRGQKKPGGAAGARILRRAKSAGAEKSGKKKKPGRRAKAPARGRTKNAAPDRNVFEDLMTEEQTESERSIQDTMSELLKIGLDGDWSRESESGGKPDA